MVTSTFIIAEAGVNHNGDLDRAIELVEIAAESGADAVKFQTFRAEALVTAEAGMAAYQKKNLGVQESQLAMLKKLELGIDAFEEIKRACDRHAIEFMSTPFDEGSADALAVLGMQTWKVPSGELTNLPLIRHIAAKRKPMIISTGMAQLGDIELALEAAQSLNATSISLLHCVSAYPADFADINLRAMETMKSAFQVPVGLSDHSLGIEIPIAAVALGATIIEKHFTQDREMPGPDHRASLEPDELKQMVSSIRNVELAIGDGRKRPTPAEMNTAEAARRSWVYARAMPDGHLLAEGDLVLRRPGTGIAPHLLDALIGRRLHRGVEAGVLADWSHLS